MVSISARRERWLSIHFAATIFISAFLLFQVQPLVSKYILPWFGGSPAVWTTSMLFFQTLLFGGYAYAHFSVRWLRPRQQAAVHLVLIVAAIVLLRVVPGDDWKPTDSQDPVWQILKLLAATVGLPYFVLSSTGPLVQAWFARVFPGRIPYRLYALSNAGSLLALLSYPYLFERIYSVPQQAVFWTGGYVVYGILCALAAVSVWMLLHGPPSPPAREPQGEATGTGSTNKPIVRDADDVQPRWWHRALWMALPAFASVTLLATTNHITTDVSPIPFLWVVPFSLYLLTFIIAFDHPRWYWPAATACFAMVAVYVVAILTMTGLTVEVHDFGTPGAAYKQVHQAVADLRAPDPAKAKPNVPDASKIRLSPEVVADLPDSDDSPKPKPKKRRSVKSPEVRLGFLTYVAINMAAMFAICMLCHGELVRIRPHPSHLTGYYLMISAGGALGGVLVTIVAPQVFLTYFEFDLALLGGYLLAIAVVVRWLLKYLGGRPKIVLVGAMLWILPALAIPTLLVVGMGMHDVLAAAAHGRSAEYRVRNFFGALAVIEDSLLDGDGKPRDEHYVLLHGSIRHGLQFIDKDLRHLPTSYYAPSSGVGLAIGYYRRDSEPFGHVRIGAVGLGVGMLAAYVDQGDSIRFYEINPAIVDIAKSGKWFTYLKDCKGKYEIVLGDARLSMEREADSQRFQVLVLDAFTGDAIPAHLLTKEAFEIYLRHLSTIQHGGIDGAIVVHISNRYIDLEPVVRGLAEHFKLHQIDISNDEGANMVDQADWIVLTRNTELAEDLAPFANPPEKSRQPAVLWTDAHHDIISLMR